MEDKEIKKGGAFLPDKERSEQDGTEYKFGAITEQLFVVPQGERKQYRPPAQLQRTNNDDVSDCVTRNVVVEQTELELTYAYRKGLLHPDTVAFLEGKNSMSASYIEIIDGLPYVILSDAYIAILSGTPRAGNSLKAPLQAAHDHGFVPKKLLPLEDWMTFEDYHNPKRITAAIKLLGEEFAFRLQYNYEQVRNTAFKESIKKDMIGVGLHAWHFPEEDGIYRCNDTNFNHATTIYEGTYEIFDSYDPFEKTLAPDYSMFEWGYHTAFTKERTTEEVKKLRESFLKLFSQLLTAISKLLAQVTLGKKFGSATKEELMEELKKLIAKLIALLKEKLREEHPSSLFPPPAYDLPPEELPMNQPSSRLMLLETAKEWIGKDARPLKLAPQRLGCAEAVSTVLHDFDASLPNTTISTIKLNGYLRGSEKFKGTLDLLPGNVIVSPTDDDSVGHTGIILEDGKICSNDSTTGVFSQNYTINSWVKKFRHEKGLRIFVYEAV